MRTAVFTCLVLTGCSAQSDGPLFDASAALPLRAGTSLEIDLVMPDGDGGPVLLSVEEDGRTLLLASAETDADESNEDLASTFHPLPGTDHMMISQSRILIRGVPKNDLHGYHILDCPVDGQLRVFKFDLLSLEALGPFDGVDFSGLYVPEMRDADGLKDYYRAATTLDSFVPVHFSPAIDCNLIFE